LCNRVYDRRIIGFVDIVFVQQESVDALQPDRELLRGFRVRDIEPVSVRWIPARSRVEVRYLAAVARTDAAPARLLKTGDGARFA
jgi:hypothetical protein